MALPTEYTWPIDTDPEVDIITAGSRISRAEVPCHPDLPSLSSVDVWAYDYLMLQFNQDILVNSYVTNVNNYTITATNPSEALPVTVIEVHQGNQSTNDQIFLIVSPFTIGQEYTITVSPFIRNPTGHALGELNNYGKFVGRTTKIDTVITTRPSWYDTRPKSLFRVISNAIGRSDDLIGGSRHDRLLPNQISLTNTVTFISVDTTPTYPTNGITLDVDLDTVNQTDTLLAVIAVDATTSGDPTSTITPPTGWNLVKRMQTSTVAPATAAVTLAVYTKTAQEDEEGTYTWSTPSYLGVNTSGAILVYRGVNIIVPVDVTGSTTADNSATTNIPSVDPNYEKSKLVLIAAATSDSYASITPNTPTSRISLTAHSMSLYAYDLAIATDDPTDTYVLLSTASQLGANIGCALILRR